MPSIIRYFLNDRRANSATEFALILPVMLVFMVGIVEFGRWFQAYDGVSRLATRYASAYADCNDNPTNASPSPQACNTELGLYWPAAAIKNIAPQFTNGTPQVRMFWVQYSSTGSMTVVYQYASSGGLISQPETQAAQNAIYIPLIPETGVVVTISYTFTPLFFTALFQRLVSRNLNINYTIAQRG